MKRLSILVFGMLIGLGTFVYGDWGDTDYWKSEASTGNWNSESWYNDTRGWDNHNPNYVGGQNLVFGNNNQLTMNNDFSGNGIKLWQIGFDAGANQARTVSGATENEFYDNGGTAPQIRNESTAHHSLNFPMKIMYSGGLGVALTSGDLTLGGAMDMNGNDINISGDNDLTLSGSITAASGAAEINKGGNGTLTLSGNNASQSFQLNVMGGEVVLQNENALGTAYGDKINFATANSTLRISANISPASLGIHIANNVTPTFEVDAGRTFTVAGVITDDAGSSGITKTGGGTMILQSVNTIDGTTTINAGTLDVANGASVGTTVVNSSGTLKGAGTTGGLTVNGTISPGNSPGTLNAGSTAWNGGGTYLWEINDVDNGAGTDPGWDLLDVTGTLTINANSGNRFTIDITSLTLGNTAGNVADFDTQTSYTWIIASASDGISGFDASDFTLDYSGFSNPNSQQWGIQQNGNNIELTYTGGDPVTSSAPEPASSSLLLVGVIGTLLIRQKVQK